MISKVYESNEDREFVDEVTVLQNLTKLYVLRFMLINIHGVNIE